jgi:SAM-dependent methyltransferase
VSKDAYEGFAERYGLLRGERYPGEAAFYRKLFDGNDVRAVLDCGCGTGLDLKLFVELGREAWGVDISPAMLARARKNLSNLGDTVRLVEADLRELPERLGREFDALTCLAGPLLELPDDAEAGKALESMKAVLRPGGILVLTQGTTDKQWRERPRFILARDDAELTRIFAIDYVGDGARYNVLDVLRRDGESRLGSWSIEYPRMRLRDDYEGLLREAGFEPVEFYGGYDFETYDKGSSGRLVIVARKPAGNERTD